MTEKQKKRWGDRFDGVLLRDLDPMHFIVPLVFPSRCDNEAYISELIDLTALDAFLEKKNAQQLIDAASQEQGDSQQDIPYTLFHAIVTAILKTITLRPKLNRFIANKNTYQRKYISAAFVVKKHFSDEAEEALAFVRTTPSDTLDTIHESIRKQVFSCRSEKLDGTSQSMDAITRLPRPIGKAIGWGCLVLDRHGWVPRSMISSDLFYNSVVLSNLGSIKLNSGYHHLTNWGTNSLFVIVGEKKTRPFFHDDGTFEMRSSVELGITIDERIADGYYYSKSIRLFKKLLENPELLETALEQEVEYK